MRRRNLGKRQERDWWTRQLQSQLGRQIIWGLLSDLRTFDPGVFGIGANGAPDQYQTSFYRGQQEFGLRLYRTLIGYAPEHVVQMHREHDGEVRAVAKRRK